MPGIRANAGYSPDPSLSPPLENQTSYTEQEIDIIDTHTEEKAWTVQTHAKKTLSLEYIEVLTAYNYFISWYMVLAFVDTGKRKAMTSK